MGLIHSIALPENTAIHAIITVFYVHPYISDKRTKKKVKVQDKKFYSRNIFSIYTGISGSDCPFCPKTVKPYKTCIKHYKIDIISD